MMNRFWNDDNWWKLAWEGGGSSSSGSGLRWSRVVSLRAGNRTRSDSLLHPIGSTGSLTDKSWLQVAFWLRRDLDIGAGADSVTTRLTPR